MAYTLDQAQEDALRTERDNLQDTINGYDQQNFIDSINNGVTQAEEVDEGFERVFTSFHSSVDGAQIREFEIDSLDGTAISDPINNNALDLLVEMGQITPVINQITERATPASSSEIESSALIRDNINRFYPDADNRTGDVSGFPSSTSTDVFPGPTLFALNRRNETNVLGNPTTITLPLLSATFQDSVDSNLEIIVDASERFIVYYIDFLNNPGGNSSSGANGMASNINLVDINGLIIGGSVTITSMATGTTDTTYSPAVGDNISVGGATVQVIVSNPGASIPGMTTGFTRTSTIEFLNLSNFIPANGVVLQAAPDNAGLNAQIFRVESIRHFPDENYANQQQITDRVNLILSQLPNIYLMRYNAANSRANWNNGSLSALQSRLQTRLNLLNPDTLFAMGLIPDASAHVNEYTRAEDRIAYINSIFIGATPPIVV